MRLCVGLIQFSDIFLFPQPMAHAPLGWIIPPLQLHSGWNSGTRPAPASARGPDLHSPVCHTVSPGWTTARSCPRKVPGCLRSSSAGSSQRPSKKKVEFSVPDAVNRKASIAELLISAHPEWTQELEKAKGSEADIQRAANRPARCHTRHSRTA
jgi:hypothetical protein